MLHFLQNWTKTIPNSNNLKWPSESLKAPGNRDTWQSTTAFLTTSYQSTIVPLSLFFLTQQFSSKKSVVYLEQHLQWFPANQEAVCWHRCAANKYSHYESNTWSPQLLIVRSLYNISSSTQCVNSLHLSVDTWITPGMHVSVVNSYAAHSLSVDVSAFNSVDCTWQQNTN